MKKIILSTLSSLCIAACASLYADNYSDFEAYKAGDSMAWFYELRNESMLKAKAPKIEEKLLSIIAEKKIDDAAFDRACEILKPIASAKSVPVLAKFLHSDFRVPWVCSVFITIESSDVEDALIAALDGANAKCSMDILSTLASRGTSAGFKTLKKYVDSSDRQLACFAVSALVKFIDGDSVDVLNGVVAKNDFRRQPALQALSMIAYRAAKSGRKALAFSALKNIPEDFSMAVSARAKLAKNANKYLDGLIIADGKNVKEAARLIYNTRKFDESEAIISAFPNLSKKAKLAAMGTFMLSGDTRFYPTIAPLLDSPDFDLKDEAVYVARFICTDEANLRKIYPLIKDSNRILSSHARNVFEENPSFAAARILKEAAAAGDNDALVMLVTRGDIDAKRKLSKMYFDGGFKDGKISQMMESTITYGDMRAFAANLKTADAGLRKDVAKIIIKKLAKSRDKMFVSEAAFEIFDGNISPNDEMYKFIVSKLKVKPQKRKDVWQNEYRQRAVEDKFMKVAEEREPDVKGAGFVSMFDGKTLDGWKTPTGNASYSVKDGCVLGVTDPKMKQNSFLVSERSDYKDFIFTCEFKWEEFGNSGVIFRGQVDKNGRVVGPQAEMDDSPKRRWSAGVYNEGAEWKYSLSRSDHETARNAVCLDGWNRMTIKCSGDRIQTWLNGVPVSDFVWEGTKPGFFGLQVHAGKRGTILWKNIKVKELK